MDDDEAAMEEEAMVAILGDDIRVQSRDGGARELVLYVTPESDPATEAVGAVLLTVTLPQGYPAGAAAQVAVSSTAGHEFAHRLDDPWPLSSEHAAELSAVVAAATHGRPGEQVVWDCVDGVRQWLEVHTLTAKPSAPSDEVSRLNSRLDDAEISEDDLALDEEDMDEEMIEALREVLRGGGKLVRMLDEAEAMKAGSRAQKAALHAIWLGLSDAQRKEMVADSGDDEDDDSDDSGGGGGGRGGGGGGGGGGGHKGQHGQKGRKPHVATPPAAQRTCPRGHTLCAVVSKPDDYKRLEGNVGNCDVCDVDFKYTAGGYHCDSCKNWDCCVRCGSEAAPAANKGGGGKGKKRGKRG